MEKKNISIKSIILSISLAIIAITIIISLGIGIEIFKPKAQADYKTLDVAAKQLNKLNSKHLKLNGKDLLTVDLNTVALSNKLKQKQLLAKDLDTVQKELPLTELNNSKLLLANDLNKNHRTLGLSSLNVLTRLQPSLAGLA